MIKKSLVALSTLFFPVAALASTPTVLQGINGASPGQTVYFAEFSGTVAGQAGTLWPWVSICDPTTAGQCAPVTSTGLVLDPSNLMSTYGQTLPTKGSAIGVNSGGNMVAPHICTATPITLSETTTGDYQFVAPVSGKTVYVCGVSASSNGTANFHLEGSTTAGSGGACGTVVPSGNPGAVIGTTWYTQQGWGKLADTTYWQGLAAPSGDGLCLNVAGTGINNLSVTVFYDQY
jgi:hypothetical protein